MASQIVSFNELTQQVKAGVISDEEVEHLYGSDTLRRIYDHLQECYYGSYYA